MHLTMKSGNILRRKLQAKLVTTAVLINMKTKCLWSLSLDAFYTTDWTVIQLLTN